LETVGFGWTDPDMKTNRQSPYFLGAWFPDNKPDFFFKPAQVKEPYKTLLFAPQYRIPLYQTVFHDEVINSHHWHSDSLKFSNVQAERDLIAMLYNTPAMIHLSRDEATPNSARVNALRRYQQGFTPIHEVVWNQPLVDFKWLDEQGMVQQTTFGDGSKITANFSTQPYKKEDKEIVPALSIQAELSNGQNLIWPSDTLKTEK
ncbi:glycoside hydrolase, partial [Vibrio anguillarum]